MSWFKNIFSSNSRGRSNTHRGDAAGTQPILKGSNKIDTQKLEAVAVVFEALDRFRKGNLLYVDFKRNAVTISAPLAQLFIYEDKDWQNFLHNLHLWAVCQYNINEYTRNYNKLMADAEAEAYHNKNMQRAEADRQPLTDAERRLARMRAAASFDSSKADHRSTLPNLQFVVIGAIDGEPLAVARLKDGVYETLPVPDHE